MAYRIEFAESVKEQLKVLTARQRGKVLDTIEAQLVNEPLKETRNRKLLRPNPLAPWELRIGKVRVFYKVTEDEPDLVKILAVGEKRGNKLFISGEEVEI
jgi:mRNA-degrading endonuclease RelE of RelBE toxin-antitoxin system